MKFTLSWLRTHLETAATPEEIGETLTRIGLELESLEHPGAALATFRIARVLEATQHPTADRLRVCKVDFGDGITTVVCGAPNARTGMKGVFAAPGSYIPGTGITLKTAEVRGIQSAGMLLSAREMGLGDDHTGIIDLPEDAPVGIPYPEYAGLDDPVFDIAITPNRGDCFSVRGVARDLAAAGLGTLRPWSPEPVPPVFDGGLRWQIDWPEACPWILGRTIRNLRNSESPDWLARRLTAIGLRPINALVDVTNFFTFDLGRPLHVFDTDKVAGDVLTLRRGAGETFRALNGKDYTLTAEDCAIADAAGVQSMAGVMGGEASGCDETTTCVFIECALFDPVRVALTGRRHQVTSDARQRFERGIDPAIMPVSVEAATRLILDICGGEPGPVVSAGHPPDWHRSASLRFARLAEFGGAEVPPEEAIASLERLGFTVQSRDNARVTVAVPSWRNDIAPGVALDQAPGLGEAGVKAAAGCAQVEPEADLIEEILRLRGLDSVPPVSPPRAAPVPLPTLTPRQTRAALVRRTLAAQGLAECVTFSFMAAKDAGLFGETPPELRVSNPIAADLDQMRPTPVATLALVAKRNAARGWPDLALFEIGPAFSATGQNLVAAGLRTGSTPRNWAEPARPVDALDAKADLFAAFQALAVPLDALSVTPDAPGFYHPGRSGTVRQGPKTIVGTFGELYPSLDLPGPAVAFELFLDAIPDPKRRRRSAPDLPLFQPVRRDFAFVVDASVPADAVIRAAKGADRALITSVILFDRYQGPNIPRGKTSLAVEVTFQPRDHTLTDAELEAAAAKVVSAVAKATGAELR
jgi:phenylalanyl-tRNA synthetase beta chain